MTRTPFAAPVAVDPLISAGPASTRYAVTVKPAPERRTRPGRRLPPVRRALPARGPRPVGPRGTPAPATMPAGWPRDGRHRHDRHRHGRHRDDRHRHPSAHGVRGGGLAAGRDRVLTALMGVLVVMATATVVVGLGMLAQLRG